MSDKSLRTYTKRTMTNYKKIIWNGRICTIEKSLCLIFLPLVLSLFINEVYYHRDRETAISLLIIYSIFFFGFIVIWTISSYVWFYFLNKYVVNLRISLFKKFCFMKQLDLDSLDTGETEILFTSDVTKFNDELAANYIDIFNYSISLILPLIIVFFFDKWICLVIIILIPIAYFLNKKISKLGEVQSEKKRETYGKFLNKLFEYLNSVHEMKVFGVADNSKTKYSEYVTELNEQENRNIIYRYSIDQLNKIITLLINIAVYAISAMEFVKGNISIGSIIAIIEYIHIIQVSFSWFGTNIYDTRSRIINLRKVTEFINKDDECKNFKLPKIRVETGKIEFKNIFFSYNQKKVFENANLVITPNTKTAIIGANGAGKSTLMKLLMGLYEIKDGKILVDNQDISRYSYRSLRDNISYVNQNIVLFSDTIRNNIALWNNKCTDSDIYEACRKAGILEMIEKLPEKLDTVIGENNFSLSKGQKQRLLLARVFLQDTPIIIWDEATASLDDVTERDIVDNLCKNCADKTTIIITHTAECVSICDKIVICDSKKIRIFDKDDEKLKKNKIYKEILSL